MRVSASELVLLDVLTAGAASVGQLRQEGFAELFNVDSHYLSDAELDRSLAYLRDNGLIRLEDWQEVGDLSLIHI